MLIANVVFAAPAYVYVIGIMAWPITIAVMLAEIIEKSFYRWSRIKDRPTKPWLCALLSNAVSYGFIFASTIGHW